MDAVLLSRIQFAITISFHYIFPPLTIGLGLVMVITEGIYVVTKNSLYLTITKFWTKIFGLTFALGVASGVVMEFQFGTNWATYSRFVGDVFGSPLAAEGIFAFFLESGFLAIVLFGWNRVAPKMHFFSTLMVALGAMLSAVWIVVANSWQQTPAGYHLVGHGISVRAEITDFWAMVFNPSSFDRLSHVLMGAWQAGAWFVVSVSAYYLLKRQHLEFAKASLKISLLVAAFSALGQLGTGHTSAIGVSKYQPAKLAAFEGHFEESAPANLNLFGWVDEKNNQTRFAFGIPGGTSFLVSANFKKPLKGLLAFPKEDRPPVNIVFQAYHLMVMIGFGLIGLSLYGLFLLWRGKLFETRWLLCLFVVAMLGPQVANQVGWMSAEIGRQPWVVYGLLRTAEGVSKAVSAQEIFISVSLFSIVYLALLVIYLFLLSEKIKTGPVEEQSMSGRSE